MSALGEDEEKINKTSFEAIYGGFDNITFHYRNRSVRVSKLEGPPISDEDALLLRPVISNVIKQTEAEVTAEVERSLSTTTLPKEVDELSEALGLDGEEATPIVLPQLENAGAGEVLVEVPLEGKVDIYPRTWFCKNCGYYRLASPGVLKSLECPWCRGKYSICRNPKCARKNRPVPRQDSCAACGFPMGNLRLYQLSILFVCPRCARQEEICPPFVRPENAKAMFECEECGKPLRLNVDGPMTKWSWECSSDPSHQCLRSESRRVNQFCPECSTWGKNGEPRRPVTMRLRAASSNYLRPRILSLMRVGSTLDISEELLAGAASWKLGGQEGDEWNEKRELLARYAIDDIWVVDSIRSYTINYGYTFASYDPDLKVRLYSSIDPRTKRPSYKAYAVGAEGKGLYVKLNKEAVSKAIGIKPAEYDSVASNSVLSVKNLSSRELKERGDTLIPILHGVEHALISQASLVTGLADSAFTGKILLRDCGVLIAEREDVETSGVDYIVQRKLTEWLSTAQIKVSDCRYDCQTACVKCLFVRDALCHPLIPVEGGDRFYTPNNLLSRKDVLKLWRVGTNA